jgi:hypothetical protein
MILPLRCSVTVGCHIKAYYRFCGTCKYKHKHKLCSTHTLMTFVDDILSLAKLT